MSVYKGRGKKERREEGERVRGAEGGEQEGE